MLKGNGVVWLANHNAHTYFGLQVLGQLPPDLRELCTEDLPVFHLGLYGSGPADFLPLDQENL